VPFRRGRDAQCPEDPAGRGRVDPAAELEQLALDPLVPPVVILAGEPPEQHGDLGALGYRCRTELGEELGEISG
jgi:hypothetical protein